MQASQRPPPCLRSNLPAWPFRTCVTCKILCMWNVNYVICCSRKGVVRIQTTNGRFRHRKGHQANFATPSEVIWIIKMLNGPTWWSLLVSLSQFLQELLEYANWGTMRVWRGNRFYNEIRFSSHLMIYIRVCVISRIIYQKRFEACRLYVQGRVLMLMGYQTDAANQ